MRGSPDPFTTGGVLQYAWLTWSVVLVAIWGVVFAMLKDAGARREMLVVSAVTSLFGLSEPIFVPAYWTPPSLFDLAARTGFDLESLLFSFAIGGLAVALYEAVFPSVYVQVERAEPRHWLHPYALASAPVSFALLYVLTPLNPIYSASIAFIAAGLFTSYCRPDLVPKMLVSAGIFLALYFVFFLSLVAVFPDYVERVWNLPALSGVLILGVPMEELLFAATFGFMWSSTYEHARWLRTTKRWTRRRRR